MNPIREYFRRKNAERKFKVAGPGHRLAESASKETDKNVASSSRIPDHCQKVTQRAGVVRSQPSEGAKRAGAAALARVEQKHQPTVNWSLAATRAQAKKELELENSAKLKHGPIEVVQDSCPVLSVSGVYYACPIIGPDVLSLNEIEAKIREFLYDQLEYERGLTACLIVHTCNKNKEKVRIGVETLARYLTNIVDNPTEGKFHKIRLKNKVFQDKVAGLEGAFDVLIAAGFSHQTLKEGDKEEEYFVFPKENLGDLENLQILKEGLLSAEPIVPVLDRNLKVLLPLHAKERIHLPDDFFNLSADEVRREHEAKSEEVELRTQLRTKAMRQRDEVKELHMYKYSLIRVRFPDGIILQATFHVYEKLGAVKELIIENLSMPDSEFDLLAPGGSKLIEDDQTLLELKLVPASLLNFHWQSSDISEDNRSYLNPETMTLLENL